MDKLDDLELAKLTILNLRADLLMRDKDLFMAAVTRKYGDDIVAIGADGTLMRPAPGEPPP